MNFLTKTIKSIKNKVKKLEKYLEDIDKVNKDYCVYWYSDPTDTSMIPVFIKLDEPKKKKNKK